MRIVRWQYIGRIGVRVVPVTCFKAGWRRPVLQLRSRLPYLFYEIVHLVVLVEGVHQRSAFEGWFIVLLRIRGSRRIGGFLIIFLDPDLQIHIPGVFTSFED